MNVCVVPGCTSVSQLVRFPREKKMIKEWIASIKNPVLKRLRFGQIYKSKRICVDHFDSTSWDESSTITNVVLLPTAVPILNLPGQPTRIKCLAHLDWVFSPLNLTSPILHKSFQKLLKYSVLDLSSVDRTCVLTFTTMPLKPQLNYDYANDIILGWGNGRAESSRLYADTAIVFMVRGLYTNWKQMIFFTFCEKDIPTDMLVQTIKDVLTTCFYLRLKVVATVCPATSNNVTAMNNLKYNTHNHCLHSEDELGYDSFVHSNREIIILYDPPNLLKDIRNVMLENDLQYTIDDSVYTASWKDIVKFFYSHPEKVADFNLTKDHVLPSKIKKNSVNTCTKVFSSELATAILDTIILSDTEETPTLEGTGNLLKFFNELLESLSGTGNKPPINKPLNRNVTPGSKHWDAWNKSLKVLNSMQFLDEHSSEKQPICLKKWISTLHGILHLWRGVLQRSRFKSFTPKFLQLKELEKNLLRIRYAATKKDNEKLSCQEFVVAFSSTIISFPDTRIPLCDATRPLLLSMFQFIINNELNSEDFRSLDAAVNVQCRTLLTAPYFEDGYKPILYFGDEIHDPASKSDADELDSSKTPFETFPRIAANKYIAEKFFEMLETHNCTDCQNVIFGSNNNPHTSLFMRFSDTNFTKAFNLVADHVNKILPVLYRQPNIKTKLESSINKHVDIQFLQCERHILRQVFVKMCVHYMIATWLWKINQYLRGEKSIVWSNNDKFLKQAVLIHNRHKESLSKSKTSAIRFNVNKKNSYLRGWKKL